MALNSQKQTPSIKVDERDLSTPDGWIPRDPRLIRLTGVHPFNAEPPLHLLLEAPTPSNLHYVRNHGSVPRLDWNTHKVSFTGLIDHPREFSMPELLAKPALRLAVTLACDGNRRGEMNVIQRTHFTWGAAATSTSIWTGVPLADLLREVGVTGNPCSGHYVCFEGSDTLAKGRYGTSIPLAFAIDPNNAVMLAYEMNDAPLPPDHGFPIRLIIPGHVGGRQVKWLHSVHIIDKESDNYYHLHDNKVLPPHVDLESAGPYWERPEYTLYELNVNSVIVTPDHGENWLMRGDAMETRTVRGFAYTGGGRRISRVELSLDGGSTWEPCQVENSDPLQSNHSTPTSDPKTGANEGQDQAVDQQLNSLPNAESRGPVSSYLGYKCFTCSYWQLELPYWKLLHANELIVRAVDESLNMQPEHAAWNVLGMMNNSWYRVKVFIETALPPSTSVPKDGCSPHPVLCFSHPVVPDGPFHGWMRPLPSNEHIRQALEAGSVARPRALKLHGLPSTEERDRNQRRQRRPAYWGGAQPPQFTASEVSEHATEEDCWVIIDREVYDLSPYLKEHPGGVAAILCVAGTDATREFHQIHSHDAYEILGYYRIGSLVIHHSPSYEANPQRPKPGSFFSADNQSILTVRRWVPFVLAESKQLTHDTLRFKFVPSPQVIGASDEEHGETASDRFRSLGLPVGQHILVSAQINGQIVTRPYTPIAPATAQEDDGSFVLLVKVYMDIPPSKSNPHGRPGGVMSQHLAALSIGAAINVKGPAGPVQYLKGGFILNQGGAIRAERISMIAGGTGITPIFQLLRSLLEDDLSSSSDERVTFRLLFANRSEKDILLKSELDDMASRHSDRFQVHYTLSTTPEDWKGETGHVTQQMLSTCLFSPGPASVALLCGPPIMIEHSCVPYLLRLGFAPNQIIEF